MADITSIKQNIRQDKETLVGIPGAIMRALVEYRNGINAIGSNADLSATGRSAAVPRYVNALNSTLDNLETKAIKARDGLTRTLAAVDVTPILPTDRLTLGEIQAQRTWERLKPLLSGGDLLSIAIQTEKAADRKDTFAFKAFYEELPAFMELNGQGNDAINTALDEVTKTEFPILPEDRQFVRQEWGALIRGYGNIEADFYSARKEIETEQEGAFIVEYDGRVAIKFDGTNVLYQSDARPDLAQKQRPVEYKDYRKVDPDFWGKTAAQQYAQQYG